MTRIMNTVGATVTVEWLSGGTTAATLAVVQPDGTSLTPAPTVSVTNNRQSAFFIATQAGVYGLTWTLANGAVQSDIVDVWPLAPRYLVSVADVMRRLAVAGPSAQNNAADWFETLSLYIASASLVVESITGALLPKASQYVASGRWDRRKLVLPASKITVESVTVDDVLLIEGSQYKVDTMAGIIISDSFTEGDLNITVQFTAGSKNVPPQARQACLEIGAYMWQISRQGSRESGTTDEIVTTASGWAVPRRAWELLQSLPSTPGFA